MARQAIIVMIVLGALGAVLMLPACKRTGEKDAQTAPASPEQAHQQKMLEKSFEESKKVVAARVNGADITEFLVYREMNAIGPQLRKPGQKPSADLETAIRRDALTILITQELAVQEAKKSGLTMPPAVMEDALRKMRANAGSEDAFQAGLRSSGLSVDELRAIIEREYLFEQIAAREVDGKIKVTDAELRTRYAREQAALKNPAHRQMTYEEAKPLLLQNARAEAAEKRMREWEKELRKNARVEIVEKKP